MDSNLRLMLLSILFHLVNTEDSSNDYVRARLKAASATDEEIKTVTGWD